MPAAVSLDHLGEVLDAPPPPASAEDAVALARDHFGLDAEAKPLTGERDRNFYLRTKDGAEYVLKIVHPGEDPAVTDFQNQALLHLAKADPSLPLSLATGGASGLASGFAALGGMPLAVFWLASQRASAKQVRDNLMAYFGLSTLISGVVFTATGVLTGPRFAEAVPLLLPYGLGLWVGSHGFARASDRMFRVVAYAVILVAVCLALPLR